MTRKALQIYWQSECAQIANNLPCHLKEMFGLESVLVGELEPPVSALDPQRQQYDVRYLIPVLEEVDFSLWILKEDISEPYHLYLYGVASDKTALVSAYRARDGENFLKEVYHEVGHLLGLEHCRGKCVMRRSRNNNQLDKKPLTLCSRCRNKVNKSQRVV